MTNAVPVCAPFCICLCARGQASVTCSFVLIFPSSCLIVLYYPLWPSRDKQFATWSLISWGRRSWRFFFFFFPPIRLDTGMWGVTTRSHSNLTDHTHHSQHTQNSQESTECLWQSVFVTHALFTHQAQRKMKKNSLKWLQNFWKVGGTDCERESHSYFI